MILIDTNILVRLRDESHPQFTRCKAVLTSAAEGRVELAICAQVMIEYWAVATRPKENNGLAMLPDQVADDLEQIL